jgi:general secretion pathway protein D
MAQPAPADQPPVDTTRPEATKAVPELAGKIMSFEFTGAPLEVVMEDYCRWTGKIYLKTDAVKASITLKADKITTEEGIKIVEAILAMNNVALVPMGDKYIKVVMATAGDLTGQGLSINLDPEEELGDSDQFVTKIIQLQNVEIQEVQAAVQHVMHAYGKIMGLQRSNSLMITDTEANVKRALEIIRFIDQGSATVESRIYEIKHAEATEIATKLKEIVEAAQADQKKTPTATTASTVRTPPGVIRPTTQQRAAAAPKQASIGQTEGGTATIITGTVKILSDDRTNIIIIFSPKENFTYFDKIIKVLDVEVEPAVNFEVVNLEYADAVELSGTLNDLVGAATGGSTRSSSSSSSRSSSSRSSSSSSRTSSSRNTSSNRNTGTSRVTPNSAATGAINNLSKLSENTKILADERTNSIILMGEKGDIAAIKVVIKHLDIMLEQVIIEAAIFEVGLSDSLRHGIDWLYQSQDGEKVGAWDGNNLINSTNGIATVAASALTYYQNITGINTELAINLAATDNDAKLVSTPVIMTTDNTEATLSIGEQRPVVTSTSSYANSSGTQSSTYEYKDIGIQLTVTPRINPQRFVVMELTQKADQLGGSVTIDDNDVPIILNREFGAQIAVPDGGTVVLGGLVNTEWEDNVTKIPLLGDIPLIGRYLFSSVSKEEVQRELIVLMSPYVMTDMNEMRQQTERLYKGTNLRQEDWGKNWSQSPLRNLPDPVEGEDGVQTEKQQEPTEPAPSHDEVMQMMESMDSKPAE